MFRIELHFSVCAPIRAMPTNLIDFHLFSLIDIQLTSSSCLCECTSNSLSIRCVCVCRKVRAIEARFERNAGRRPSQRPLWVRLTVFLSICLWELIARVEQMLRAGPEMELLPFKVREITHQGWDILV